MPARCRFPSGTIPLGRRLPRSLAAGFVLQGPGRLSRDELWPAARAAQDSPRVHSRRGRRLFAGHVPAANALRPGGMFAELVATARERIVDAALGELVVHLLESNREQLLSLPAATHNHHAFAGGWLEHVLSVTRTSVYLADKYDDYYPDLRAAAQQRAGRRRGHPARHRQAARNRGAAAGSRIHGGRPPDRPHPARARHRARSGRRPVDRRRRAPAAGAHHRIAPATARVGLAQAADDPRGAAGPLRRRRRRQVPDDGRHAPRRREPGPRDLEKNPLHQKLYRGEA